MAHGSEEGALLVGSTRPSALRRLAPFSLVVALIVEFVIFAAIQPTLFLTSETVVTILSGQAPLLIATLALTLTLIVNEFDLTVGATLVFTEVIAAALTVKYNVPAGTAAVVALAGGTLVGVINAFLVVGLGIPSFVVTLGVGTLLSGISLALADSTFIVGVPEPLVAFASTDLFGVSISVYYAFGFAVLLWYVYEHTPIGRYLYFTGANVEVARLSGIPTAAVKVGAFVVSAAVISVAGLLEVGTIGSADPSGARNFLLPAFAGAFLGATAIKVGRFNVWGTVIASYLIFAGITGFALLGLSGWVQDVFNGLALLSAAIAARLTSR